MQSIAGEVGTLEAKIKSFLRNALEDQTRIGFLKRGNDSATRSAVFADGLMLGQLHFFSSIPSRLLVLGRIQRAVICMQSIDPTETYWLI
ncbi:MAG: hypothetical protein A2031_03080 [Deltaproteobacteria bacterium RBG_19FT_COMBO_43_11]|nr:MAG: hypothetical protein A2031_03080 [Deltaproteobacteria bacterium RBG_19FT_COMBO_43_11]